VAAHALRPWHWRALIRVLYGSSRRPDGVNVSLFIDNDGACDPDGERDSALLVLDGHERLAG
jgi:hypothetical protein